MNNEYQKGYQKGYNTGSIRSNKAISEAMSRADNAAKRAERAEKQQGIGHCENCALWTRGCPTCSWGHCGAQREAGTPNGTWIQIDGGKIMTTPHFGCVLFQEKK